MLAPVETQAAADIGDLNPRINVYCTDIDCHGAEFVGTLLEQAGCTNVGRYPLGVAGWREAGLAVATGA